MFLPFYDEAGVEAIITHLNDSGNEAIAGTIVPRRETIILPLPDRPERAVAAIEAVPSYLVPTPRARAEIRMLADLGNFLAGTGIDPDAYKREMAGCAAILAGPARRPRGRRQSSRRKSATRARSSSCGPS